ncbi:MULTISPECIES: dihydrolipoyl dehydrogenase [Paenibacillus]|uniref:dihydrolipoyl dehydrogenase n=1 Tax=Paenibacillus TaxID=44249 RepID=UPI00020D7C30|nr:MULTISPECIES: dihydrolipoyl dehydrogenase [Paenibacillus]EGL16706.1 dihydrolipoyl dehydrogenase [Paenibacillus sp. HGF7]EPD80692.1 dihydrolipoyl dehydrogenase [Paenibacillus sp. HGH0039]MBV6714557.1 dihydrolipoyl dehydrogenase [Paenibacillus chitinolyticus]
MSGQAYDIVILGGGTGGYVAAIRAAQLGKKVALVEKDKLGGTCLHRGCIPSKALLRSAEVLATTRQAEEFGVIAPDVSLDFTRVQSRKDGIVAQIHKGVQYLMKKNKIDVFNGIGRIMAPSIFSSRSGTLSVEMPDGSFETLVPEHLILATGSRPRVLPGLEPDGEHILTSDEALALEALPDSLIIVGGGVIGVEWASMMNDFGVDVTVVEAGPRLVPTEDEEISRELDRLLRKRGVKVLANASVLADTLRKDASGVTVAAEQKGERVELAAAKILVSVGRAPNVEQFGLENTDVKLERGFIRVNGHMQTNIPHIYAIGDVIGGLQLAHAASHEGVVAVEHICGLKPHTHEAHRIPRCVYTRPEIASVGWTEAEAKEKGFKIKTGKFGFKPLGKAIVYGENDGFVKVVIDADKNDLLGVHMIGPHVTDYIAEAALAQLLEASPWEIGSTIHPHPTLSEAFAEAVLAAEGRAIHI